MPLADVDQRFDCLFGFFTFGEMYGLRTDIKVFFPFFKLKVNSSFSFL